MSTELVLQLVMIVLINAVSNTLGTLKNIFSAKKFLKPLYIVTFIDAVIFATIMKQIASGNGVYFIVAFAVGKVLGAFIADFIECRIALGILEIDLFVTDKVKMKTIGDALRKKGYSVNTFITYGLKGSKRYKVEVNLLRKEFGEFKELLKKHDNINPTFTLKEINGINGKIKIGNALKYSKAS
ncbi:MAG: hypothetical protein N2484_02375 [Clostridia bacterium]|nr:hypothetical protein [Clostridia bacterium]